MDRAAQCCGVPEGLQLFPVAFMEEAELQPVESLTDGQGTDLAFHLILPLPSQSPFVTLGMLHNLSGGFLTYKVQVVTDFHIGMLGERTEYKPWR